MSAVPDYLAKPAPRRDYLLPPAKPGPRLRDYLATEPVVVRSTFVQRSLEAEVHLRSQGSALMLEGRMVPYEEWTEIDSPVEGHFLERFARGSLGKALRRAARIRVLFEHGLDATIGMQPIAAIQHLEERADGAYYQARLLAGVPELVLSGLRAGQYGSSVRFSSVKTHRERFPRPSAHNPGGLEERTVQEAGILEFSVCTFPAYSGTSAQVLG